MALVGSCMVDCDVPRAFFILNCLQSTTVLPCNIVSTYLTSVTSLWPMLEINEVSPFLLYIYITFSVVYLGQSGLLQM